MHPSGSLAGSLGGQRLLCFLQSLQLRNAAVAEANTALLMATGAYEAPVVTTDSYPYALFVGGSAINIAGTSWTARVGLLQHICTLSTPGSSQECLASSCRGHAIILHCLLGWMVAAPQHAHNNPPTLLHVTQSIMKCISGLCAEHTYRV